MSTKLYSYLIPGSADAHTTNCISKKNVPILCLVLLISFFHGNIVSAAPVSSSQAEMVAGGFMQRAPKPLGAVIGAHIDRSETFLNVKGENLYHVVYMKPSGFIIVPADDLVEPIIAFSSGSEYDPSPANPFGALVSRDLPGRIEHVRGLQHTALKAGIRQNVQNRMLAAQQKWLDLSKELNQDTMDSLSGISDIRVAPLIESKWSQQTVSGNACYNYYTPPYAAGSSANYPCGCVATAMAQLMRFHQHPTSGVGTDSFLIEVNGTPEWRSLRGGDGSGDSYNWSDMVLNPSLGSTLTQRQAIGALCHDAGVAAGMMYSATSSGAYTADGAYAFMDTFYYDNAIAGWNYNNNFSAPDLQGMLNPNLDAKLPTLLGIMGSVGGHAIVCDGYGYSGTTMYHHLNMGWAGSDDAWYNLPDIDSSPSFDTIAETIYNVFVSGSGEIISGRVVDDLDQPIEGASVVGDRTGGGQYTSTTDSNGIYALAEIPSASSYTINVTKSGYTFIEKTSNTDTSSNDEPTSGNVWGVNFTGGEVPREIIYSFPMNSDPGWTTEGQWAFGQPLGGGGSYGLDPDAGYTGSNVYGYNLAGDYADNIAQFWLTTAALDCSAYSNVILRFYRWLGVESASYDHAEIEASNDGSTWSSIWSHTGSVINDSSWQEMSYDISSVADGQQTVYIRWGMGPTDGSVTYPGWNIDDVVLEGNLSTADSDGDGIPDAWETLYFGSPSSCIATNDGDLDGYNNLQEYICGTDPTNWASYFMITNCAPLAGLDHFVIEWNSVSGRVYSALWTTDLTNSFQNLESGIEYPRNSCTDTIHSAEDKCFYQVEVQLKQAGVGSLAGTTWIEEGYPTSSIIFNSDGTTLRIVDTSDGTDLPGIYTQTGDSLVFSASFTDAGDFIEIVGDGTISGTTMTLDVSIYVNGELFDSGTAIFTKQ